MKHPYLLALLPFSACSSPAWVSYPIDQYVAVQLPARPKTVNLDSMGVKKALKYKDLSPFRASSTEDETGAYAVLVNRGDATSSISEEANRDSLYTKGIRAVLQQAKGNHLVSRTSFRTSAGMGMEAVFIVSSPKTHTPVLVYIRTLLAHQQVYGFTYTPYDDRLDTAAHTTQRRRFFNSITVKP